MSNVLKVLQFIYDGSGNLLDSSAGGVRRLDNLTNTWQMVAPFDEASTIFASSLLASGDITSDFVFLAKDTDGTQLYGRDVVDPESPFYQQVSDYLVWEGQIGDRSLQKISKYRSGTIKVNFNIFDLEDAPELVTEIGTFGSASSTTGGDLPLPYAGSVGDYYRLDIPSYTSANANNQEFLYNEAAFWDGDSWEIGSTQRLNDSTQQKTVGVSPAVKANINSLTDDLQLALQFSDKLNDHESRITALEDLAFGGGDSFMRKSEYDTDDNGIVDKSETLDDGVNVVTAAEAKQVVDWTNQSVKTTDSPTFAGVTIGTKELTENVPEETLDLEINENVTLQVGRELLKLGRNTSGVTITNGSVVAIIGSVGNVAEIELLDITDPDQSFKVIGIATEDILNNTVGNVTLIGRVRGLDTSSWAEGTILYAGLNGTLTDVCPAPPNRCVLMAVVETSNAGSGILWNWPRPIPHLAELSDVYVTTPNDGDIVRYNASNSRYEIVDPEEYLMSRDIQNGALKETFDALYNSTSSTIDLSNPAGNTLTAQFSSGDYEIDVTTPIQISITFGASDVPVTNYIYILESAPTTPVVSTGSWPSAEHAKISEVTVLDEVYTDTEGPLGNQNHNNHEKGTEDIGALNHMRDRLRSLGAQWETGIAGATSGEYVNDVGGTLYWTSTSGTVWQLHLQTYMAKNTQTGDDMHIVNDFTSAYREITSFDEIIEYSDGTSIGNDFFNVFVYGIVNKSGEYTPIMVNVPTGGYNNQTDAESDLDGTTVTTVPTWARRTAFPIARLVLRKVGSTYSFIKSFDLREQRFGVSGSSGTGVLDGEFIDTTFELQHVADTSKVLKFSAVNVPTSTTVTITAPNADLDLEDVNTAIQQDLTEYPARTAASVADDDLARVPLDNDGTMEHMTLTEIYAGANAAAGAFVPSADYGSDGLGAHKTQVVRTYVPTQVSGGQYKINLGVEIAPNQIVWIDFPTITTTNPLELSVTDGATFKDVYAEGKQIYGYTASDRLVPLWYDGTQFNIISENERLSTVANYKASNESTFGTINPLDFGSPEFKRANGLSIVELASTPNFATDTNWTKGAGYTITGGELVLTAVADTIKATQNTLPSIGTEVYIQYKISEYTSGGVRVNAGSGALGTTRSAVGVYSEKLTVTTDTILEVQAVGATTAKLDYVYVVKVANTPLASESASDLSKRIKYLDYGFNDIVNPEWQFTGKNLFDKNQYTDIAYTYLMAVKPNAQYVWSESIGYKLYDANQIEIANGTASTVTATNAYYISFNTGIVDTDTFQLEEGTSATDYKPHNSPTPFKAIATPRSVGTAQDVIRRESDKYVLDKNTDADTTVVKNATYGNQDNTLTNTTRFNALISALDVEYPVLTTDLGDTELIIGGVIYPRRTFAEMGGLDEIGFATRDNERIYIQVLQSDASDATEMNSYMSGNDVEFRFKKATPTSTEIDTDGSTVQEDPTTIEQLGNFGLDYEVEFSIDIAKQVDTNNQNVQIVRRETGLLEDRMQTAEDNIDTLENTKQNKLTLLFTGSQAFVTDTVPPSANITLSDAFSNYDYLKLEIESDATQNQRDFREIQFTNINKSNIISMEKSLGTVNDTVMKGQLTALTTTTLVAFKGREIVYGSTYSNVASATMTIKNIWGGNY